MPTQQLTPRRPHIVHRTHIATLGRPRQRTDPINKQPIGVARIATSANGSRFSLKLVLI